MQERAAAEELLRASKLGGTGKEFVATEIAKASGHIVTAQGWWVFVLSHGSEA